MKRTPAQRRSPPGKQSRPKAATSDIVSAPPPPAKINPKWQAQYQHLSELRDHFLHRKGNLTQDANEEQPTYSEHMADAGTDSYDRDFALGMLSSDQNALYEIEEAMRRIENGTYGVCELTGKPIQKDRLVAIPWTRFSLDAEHQLEQRGDTNRARLGRLGSVTEAAGNENEPTSDGEVPEATGESNS